MDKATLNAYDRDPGSFAEDWETQPPPSDLHATVQRFFIPGGATADIGCGSGRDAAWLDSHGYPARVSTRPTVCCARPGSGIRISRSRQLHYRSLP